MMIQYQTGTLILIGIVLFISTIFGIGTTDMNDSHYIPRSKRSKVISRMKNIYGPIVQQKTIFQQKMKSMWIIKFIILWCTHLHKKASSNRLPSWISTGIKLTSDHADQCGTEVITTLTKWYTTLHNKAKLAWTSKQKHRKLYQEIRKTSSTCHNRHKNNHINRMMAMSVVAMPASGGATFAIPL